MPTTNSAIRHLSKSNVQHINNIYNTSTNHKRFLRQFLLYAKTYIKKRDKTIAKSFGLAQKAHGKFVLSFSGKQENDALK